VRFICDLVNTKMVPAEHIVAFLQQLTTEFISGGPRPLLVSNAKALNRKRGEGGWGQRNCLSLG